MIQPPGLKPKDEIGGIEVAVDTNGLLAFILVSLPSDDGFVPDCRATGFFPSSHCMFRTSHLGWTLAPP